MSKHFGLHSEEFQCTCGCRLNVIDPVFVGICDEVRDETGYVMKVTSGTRCKKHNTAIGGANQSAHLPGPDGYSHAGDFLVDRATFGYQADKVRFKLRDAFAKRGITRFEVSNKHLHVDNARYLPSPILAAVLFKGATVDSGKQ